jgi:hypothetical protein
VTYFDDMIVNCVGSICRSLIKSVQGMGLHHLEVPRMAGIISDFVSYFVCNYFHYCICIVS